MTSSEHLVNCALGDKSCDLLGWRGLGLHYHGLEGRTEHLVALHLLLAAEPLAAAVADVDAGHVAALVDHQVVRLAEAAVAPATVESLSNRLNLEGLFPVNYFGLVHVYAQADSKHVEYLESRLVYSELV